MTDREAMKMALTFLNYLSTRDFWFIDPQPQREALEAALAQPEREWVGLTVDEIMSCGWWDVGFAKAIEAKLKEKNHG